MEGLGPADVIAIWERGRARHPIDRALLLFAAARPELPADGLADLPLGARNRALLALRRATFGPEIRSRAACPACGEWMEIAVRTNVLLSVGAETAVELETDGFRLRLPTSRDLSSLVGHADEESAAAALFERCCVARPVGATASALRGLLERVEAELASLDPAADIELSVACDACRHAWTAALDVGEILWDEVDARARTLLAEVHALARAYGWSERDILALGDERRAAYLGMVGA